MVAARGPSQSGRSLSAAATFGPMTKRIRLQRKTTPTKMSCGGRRRSMRASKERTEQTEEKRANERTQGAPKKKQNNLRLACREALIPTRASDSRSFARPTRSRDRGRQQSEKGKHDWSLSCKKVHSPPLFSFLPRVLFVRQRRRGCCGSSLQPPFAVRSFATAAMGARHG